MRERMRVRVSPDLAHMLLHMWNEVLGEKATHRFLPLLALPEGRWLKERRCSVHMGCAGLQSMGLDCLHHML